MTYKILLVEDDESIARPLASSLTSWGYSCVCASDFQNVLSTFSSEAPHLVLLDISLPFYNGYHWCTEIRKLSQTPIIFLSSASDNLNIVLAINMGADDFIAKPFDLNVLIAKIQALLRRTYDFSVPSDLLECSGVSLRSCDSTVFYQGRSIELSRNESRILQVLFQNHGHIVSRATLMQRLWETDCFVDENTLSVNIARLRKKLSEIGVENLISTKKGTGYLVK